MTAPNQDVSSLNPLARRFNALLAASVTASGLPFRLYEAFRPRSRQGGVGFGNSLHGFGSAVDYVPRVNKKWSWDMKHPWREYGSLVKQAGMTWGGNFPTFDGPHADITTLISLKAHQRGYVADYKAMAATIQVHVPEHPLTKEEWRTWFLWWVPQVGEMDRRIHAGMLQCLLNNLGHNLDVDRVIGPASKRAIASQGLALPEDGSISAEMLQTLAGRVAA